MTLPIFINEDQIVKAEEEVLEECNLVKKNDRVYYSKSMPSIISKNNIILLKDIAKHKGLDACRICMHTNNEENIHEMLMIHTKPQVIKPHKQNKTSLSYHIIKGFGEVKLYNNNGYLQQKILISDSGQQHIRLDANIFRSIESKSECFIFLDVASGPFKDEDTIWMSNINE